MHDSQHETQARVVRRVGVLVAATAAILGSVTIGAGAASADAVPPTLSLSLPTTLGVGGDLQAASAEIDNTNGGDIADARVDFDITPAAGGAALNPSDLVVQYETTPGGGVFASIPLTADATGGGVSGFFGPSTGFPIAAGSDNTTNLRVTTNPGAPTGAITVTATLDTTPGDSSTAVATTSAGIAVSAPTISFADYPTHITPGDDAAFTGTLANPTGSSYGGATPTNTPDPAGVRLDFSIASSDATVTAGDLSLQYCTEGTDVACAAGTWADIPLTLTGSTFTGFFGPAGGFSLPNTASNTTPFRIVTDAASPNTTYTSTVSLNKVDATGAATGTDTTGVDNGTIATASPGPVIVDTVLNPTITAKVTSAHPASSYGAHGWYRSPVTVTFTCTAGSAALTGDCPAAKTFTANKKDHTITKSITAIDGGTATVSVSHINVDKTHPHVHITGAKNGHTYHQRRDLTAHCNDARSGIAKCKVTSHRSGHKVKWVATAKDRADNTATDMGHYFIRK